MVDDGIRQVHKSYRLGIESAFMRSHAERGNEVDHVVQCASLIDTLPRLDAMAGFLPASDWPHA
jgi:hypothetical protein